MLHLIQIQGPESPAPLPTRVISHTVMDPMPTSPIVNPNLLLWSKYTVVTAHPSSKVELVVFSTGLSRLCQWIPNHPLILPCRLLCRFSLTLRLQLSIQSGTDSFLFSSAGTEGSQVMHWRRYFFVRKRGASKLSGLIHARLNDKALGKSLPPYLNILILMNSTWCSSTAYLDSFMQECNNKVCT